MADRTQTWDIALGGTDSSWIDKAGEDIIGFAMPAAFTGTQLTFYGSRVPPATAGGPGPITYEGAAVVIPCVAGDRVSIDPIRLAAWRWVQVISDAAEAAIRTITPCFRGF